MFLIVYIEPDRYPLVCVRPKDKYFCERLNVVLRYFREIHNMGRGIGVLHRVTDFEILLSYLYTIELPIYLNRFFFH